MKLQSIYKGKNIQGAFTKQGDYSPENFDKNDGLSVMDVLLDPNNLYPVKIGDMLFAQVAVIPAKEALFAMFFKIENNDLVPGIYFVAGAYEEGKEVFYSINTDSPYSVPMEEIFLALKDGEMQNEPIPISFSSPKGKKVAFGFMTAFYTLLLALGIVGCFILPEYKAYCAVLAFLSPMWFTYYFFHDPFDKEVGKGMLVISIILSVIGSIAHLILLQSAFALIILILCYVFQFLGYAKFCQDKSSFMFVLIGIGSIIAVPLVIAVFVIGMIVLAIKFILSFFGETEFGQAFKRGYKGESEPESVYEITDEYGYKRTLKQSNSFNSNRYVDDTGSYWITNDNGATFSRE